MPSFAQFGAMTNRDCVRMYFTVYQVHRPWGMQSDRTVVLHSSRGLDVADTCRSQTVRFGLFEVDLRAGELRKNGIKIKLHEQPRLPFHRRNGVGCDSTNKKPVATKTMETPACCHGSPVDGINSLRRECYGLRSKMLSRSAALTADSLPSLTPSDKYVWRLSGGAILCRCYDGRVDWGAFSDWFAHNHFANFRAICDRGFFFSPLYCMRSVGRKNDLCQAQARGGRIPLLTLEDLTQIVRDGCAPSPMLTLPHFNHSAVSSFFDQCAGGELLVN